MGTLDTKAKFAVSVNDLPALADIHRRLQQLDRDANCKFDGPATTPRCMNEPTPSTRFKVDFSASPGGSKARGWVAPLRGRRVCWTGFYKAIFINLIVVKSSVGPFAKRLIYAAIGGTLDGDRDVLGSWAGTGGAGAGFGMPVLMDIKIRGMRTRSSRSMTA